jgi:hypothetical protein
MRGTSYMDTGEQEVLTCAVSVGPVRWKTPQVLLIMNDEFNIKYIRDLRSHFQEG